MRFRHPLALPKPAQSATAPATLALSLVAALPHLVAAREADPAIASEVRSAELAEILP